MHAFADILDLADELTLDEKESFVEIMQKRISQERRKQLISEAHDSVEYFNNSSKNTSSIEDILKDIMS